MPKPESERIEMDDGSICYEYSYHFLREYIMDVEMGKMKVEGRKSVNRFHDPQSTSNGKTPRRGFNS